MAQTCFVLAISRFWPPLPTTDDGEGMGGEKLDNGGDVFDTEPSPNPGEP